MHWQHEELQGILLFEWIGLGGLELDRWMLFNSLFAKVFVSKIAAAPFESHDHNVMHVIPAAKLVGAWSNPGSAIWLQHD